MYKFLFVFLFSLRHLWLRPDRFEMTVVTVTEYHCHLHDDDADDHGGGGGGGGNSDAGVDYFWWLTCLFYLPCILTWLQTINTVKQKYTRSVRDVFFFLTTNTQLHCYAWCQSKWIRNGQQLRDRLIRLSGWLWSGCRSKTDYMPANPFQLWLACVSES